MFVGHDCFSSIQIIEFLLINNNLFISNVSYCSSIVTFRFGQLIILRSTKSLYNIFAC